MGEKGRFWGFLRFLRGFFGVFRDFNMVFIGKNCNFACKNELMRKLCGNLEIFGEIYGKRGEIRNFVKIVRNLMKFGVFGEIYKNDVKKESSFFSLNATRGFPIN